MSDAAPGPGWWVASDGRWYPPADPSPEVAPPAAAPPPEPAPAVTATPSAPGGDLTWDGQRWIDPASGQWWDGARWQAPTAAVAPTAAAPAAPAAPATPLVPVANASIASAPASATPLGAPSAANPAGHPPAGPTKGGSGKGVMVVVGVVGILALLVAGVVVVRSRDSGPSLDTAVVADGTTASGPDELPSPDLTLTDQTVVVRGNGGATLKSMAADGSTFTLDGSAEGVDQLQPGSILLLTGVTVVKVTEVRQEGGDVVVGTEAAAIGEVIRDGTLSWDEVPTSAASIQVWDAGPDDLDESEGTTTDDGSTDDAPESTDGSDEEEGSMAADDPPLGPVAFGGAAAARGPSPSPIPSPAGDAWTGARQAMAAATAPTSGASFLSPAQADPISKSGKIGDYGYSFSKVSGADGSSSYKLGLTKEGNYLLKVDLDADIDTIISSGDIAVSNSTVDKLHLKSNKFNGTAKLSISAGTGETIAPVKQTILTIPVSINFPIVVYGIPFSLTVKGKFLIEPAFTSKNATVSGRAEVTFGGTAGLTYESGSLSAEGAMTQKGENPMQYVEGLGVGVTGIVFASQFPRLGFGLGYGSSSAGVYLASTTSAGITISSAIGMVPCNSISITSTTSAGVEAKLLGIDLPLGKAVTAEISKETWNFYAPDSEACKNMSGG